MNKILISGGCGFIGSHLVSKLESNNEILIIDDLSTGKMENLPVSNNIKFEECCITDISKISKIVTSFKPSRVFHLAAIASVQKCIEDPFYCHDVNFKGGFSLLDASIKNNVSDFYFSSSSAVYGNYGEKIVSEEHREYPESNYGLDKLAFEQCLLSSIRKKEIQGNVFRFFNIFGPKQDSSSPYAGVISVFMKIFNEKHKSLNIYGSGKQSRDFVYVKDLVNIIMQISNNKELNGHIFNIGTGTSVSINDLADTLSRIYNCAVQYNYLEPREGEILYSLCDNKKLKSLGIEFKYNLEKGLIDYKNFLENNE